MAPTCLAAQAGLSPFPVCMLVSALGGGEHTALGYQQPKRLVRKLRAKLHCHAKGMCVHTSGPGDKNGEHPEGMLAPRA